MLNARCLIVGFSAVLMQAQPPHAPLKLQTYDVNSAGVSRPARDLPDHIDPPPGRVMGQLFRLTMSGPSTEVADQVTQGSAANTSPSSTSTNFEGIAADSNNPLLAPPDENLAVGPLQIVQTVNMTFAVFNKSTGAMYPGFPKPMTALYAGTGGACELQNQSDPVVRYDRQADRWLLSYLTFATPLFLITDTHMCLAVSQRGDPTGAYYRYDVAFGARLHDYPKFAVWPDGWYMSANSFLYGSILEGSDMCAWQRDKLLVGDTTAKVICVTTGNSAFAGLLPSNWDGATAPPAGSPNYYIGLYSTAQLVMFKMTPNYITPSASQVTGPIYINVSPFNLPCGGGDCVPQKDTTQLLASLGDRVMYRLAYRNFGGYESLVANHSVGTNNTIGIRWYEIRSPGGTPAVYQQSTYAPDTDYRWMASAAMDKFGNLAMGYSKSSAAAFPGIFYTGREAGDALNSLRAEQNIWDGSGSQLPGNAGSNRWGDYSSIETDPADDCTFWYTAEYLPANGTFNWRTRIASFKFPSCGGVPKTDTTTTIASDGPDPSVTGQTYTAAVTVAPSSGSGTPTGSVAVNDGAGASCNITLAGGAGSCNLTASTAVNRTLTAVYNGDSSFNGSTSVSASHTVSKASTTTTITGDSLDPSTAGVAYQVNYLVTVNAPGAGALTGSVTVSDGTASCTAAVSAGSCSLTSTTAGAKTLTATYAGDSNFSGSFGTASHGVDPPALTPPAAPTTLTATPIYQTQGRKRVLQQINLSWQDSATNEDSFVLERWKTSGKGANLTCALETTFTLASTNVAGTGTVTYTDTSASAATCRYRVAARNTAGTSGFAATAVSP